ncbi:hypothetical protein CTAYLR_006387 [Chrysophaeum taylorii]|uniref:Uncharacterized protein n=1 Tax=Chrysophaeum taylorii TaxID=2483200 RepID=A0AAD7U7I3_9STRA|nr:hypothetical protein CTAYLR_006387 [Chrysophaeum taylorii]
MLGAIGAIARGDVAGLEAALNDDVVAMRVVSTDPPYDGYFHGATLLHHTAMNPVDARGEVCEMAKLLLDAGADVDAVTLAGPSQPKDIGWTTLGLAATSVSARANGCQKKLMDLLVVRGADLDARNGGPLMGALYYGEIEAARWLVAKGAACDAVAAAGLGDVRRLATFFEAGGLRDGAHSLAHYSQVDLEDEALRTDRAHVLGLALVYAAKNGHVDAIRFLVDDLEAPVNARPFWDYRATPLHWAAHANHLPVATFLLSRRADPGARDACFDATPLAWHRHLHDDQDDPLFEALLAVEEEDEHHQH